MFAPHLGSAIELLFVLTAMLPWRLPCSVAAHRNGTMPDLPPNFDGPKFVTKPIPGDWRLALRVDRMTVFHGGTAYVRAVQGPAFPNGGAWAPQVVELDFPKGLRIVVPAGDRTTGGVVRCPPATATLGRQMPQCATHDTDSALCDSVRCVLGDCVGLMFNGARATRM